MKRTIRRWCSGSIAHEAALALVLTIGLLAGLAQFLAITAQQRRAAAQRACAECEAGNLMERLMARPWTQVTLETVAQLEISAEGRRLLPEGQVRVKLQDEPEPVAAKRIQIQIDWRNLSGSRAVPVTLVAWKYDREQSP